MSSTGSGNVSDPSNGYEACAAEFIRRRERGADIGVGAVREWARFFAPGAAVLDLGCGSGVPVSRALIEQGIAVYGIDASPTLLAACRARFPDVPLACEPVETSTFFGRKFAGIIAIGLIFLLREETQRSLIPRVARALEPGGRFLFTSPEERCTWTDVLTRRESRSLGAAVCRALLSQAGLAVAREYTDAGGNYYYDAVRAGG